MIEWRWFFGQHNFIWKKTCMIHLRDFRLFFRLLIIIALLIIASALFYFSAFLALLLREDYGNCVECKWNDFALRFSQFLLIALVLSFLMHLILSLLNFLFLKYSNIEVIKQTYSPYIYIINVLSSLAGCILYFYFWVKYCARFKIIQFKQILILLLF